MWRQAFFVSITWFYDSKVTEVNPFQLSVAFHIETSLLFCSVKQLTGFNMKCNTGLKWFIKRFYLLHVLAQVKQNTGGGGREGGGGGGGGVIRFEILW